MLVVEAQKSKCASGIASKNMLVTLNHRDVCHDDERFVLCLQPGLKIVCVGWLLVQGVDSLDDLLTSQAHSSGGHERHGKVEGAGGDF